MTASDVFFRSLHDLLNLGEHLAVKPLTREGRRVRTNRRAVPRTDLRVIQRRTERVYRRVLEKNPRAAGENGVAHAANSKSHDRCTERHRLERRDAEVFDAGKDQALCAAEV